MYLQHTIEGERGRDQTSRHIEPLPFLARAELSNQLSSGWCASTQSPTSCISPKRPSRDELGGGQSCSGE